MLRRRNGGVERKVSVKTRPPNRPSRRLAPQSVANLRHSATPSLQRRKPNWFIFRCSVERDMSSSFAALETLPPARASARCSAARSAASTPSPSARVSADQVRRRHRSRQSLSVEAKRQPRGARRADDEIVAVDRHKRGARAFARGRQQNARLGKGEAEVLGFDRARRVRHDDADQTLQSLRSGRPGTRRRRWRRRGRHARRRLARSCN